MSEVKKPTFTGGHNVAMKVPPHEFDGVVAFYRDVLGLEMTEEKVTTAAFEFGPMILWIDRIEGISQAELWLEVDTDDTAAAATNLEAAGVTRCDAIENLPAGLDGFWIMNPANVVHLVVKDGEAS